MAKGQSNSAKQGKKEPLVKTIMIGTPTRDGKVCSQYMKGVIELSSASGRVILFERKEYIFNFVFCVMDGVSDVVGGRDAIVNEFYNTEGIDALCWIDSDTGFSGRMYIDYLLSNQDEQAFTFPQRRKTMKQGQWTLEKSHIFQENGKHYINACGFGFLHLDRSCFDAIDDAIEGNPTMLSRIMYAPSFGSEMKEGRSYHQRMMMRKTLSDTPTMLSEDKSFGFRLQQSGVKIRVFTEACVSHVAEGIEFTGNLHQELKQEEEKASN